MFDSSFLEFFSRVHWTIPIIVYIPLAITLCLYSYFVFNVGFFSIVLLFIFGVFCWSFLEYTLHRFVFHFHPKGKFTKKIFWTLHGVHHDYPSDPLRLVMPPAISVPIAIVFFYFWTSIAGYKYGLTLMAGTTIGYVCYDTIHYAIHHFPIKGRFWGKIREHHMRHHFQNPDEGFGVSSMLWDIIFKTNFEKVSLSRDEQESIS